MDFSILDQVLTKFNRVNEKADVSSCYSIMDLVIVPWRELERERGQLTFNVLSTQWLDSRQVPRPGSKGPGVNDSSASGCRAFG